MTTADRWQLPDGIEELLPDQARRLEAVRRELLDLFAAWGYDFVMPPLLEFTESLLVGLGEDLDLQTFKVIDQLSGRMLGIRADITPQTARIDAHSLAKQGVQRLCYAGSVLHANPGGLKASRAPIQVGAELFGVADTAADVEVISLMLASLQQLGIEQLTLDLGHVGIYRSVMADAGLSREQSQELLAVLQTKSRPELEAWLSAAQVSQQTHEDLLLLMSLHGGAEVLKNAAPLASSPACAQALAELESVAGQIGQRYPGLTLYFDLGELRGFNYHTGLVFAAYTPGFGRALANGGRYDDIGQAFGRARPATGFGADMKSLLHMASFEAAAPAEAIYAPPVQDAALWECMQALRAAGETVLTDLDGVGDQAARYLQRNDAGEWQVVDKGRQQ